MDVDAVNPTVDKTNAEKQSLKRKSRGTSSSDMPWVERYRPKTLDDVVGNEDTLMRLRAIAKDGNMPNLILCGPPGTGKVWLFDCICMR